MRNHFNITGFLDIVSNIHFLKEGKFFFQQQKWYQSQSDTIVIGEGLSI